jgi:hypothetical protein
MSSSIRCRLAVEYDYTKVDDGRTSICLSVLDKLLSF